MPQKPSEPESHQRLPAQALPLPPISSTRPAFPTQKKEISDQQKILNLQNSIARDQLCRADGKYWYPVVPDEDGLSRRKKIYTALLSFHSPTEPLNPCLLALMSGKEAEVLQLLGSSTEPTCVFERALVLTGQMEGLSGELAKIPENLERGQRLLRELEAQDPQNGIFPYFLAGALRGAGDPEEKDAEILAFFQAERFENPLIPLYADLRKLGLQNPTSFVYATELFSTALMPNYMPARDEIHSWIENHPSREEASRWAEKQVALMGKIGQLQLQEPFVLLIEVAVFKGIARKEIKKRGMPLPSLLSDQGWPAFYRRLSGLSSEVFDETDNFNDCRTTQNSIRTALPKYWQQFSDAERSWQELR